MIFLVPKRKAKGKFPLYVAQEVPDVSQKRLLAMLLLFAPGKGKKRRRSASRHWEVKKTTRKLTRLPKRSHSHLIRRRGGRCGVLGVEQVWRPSDVVVLS